MGWMDEMASFNRYRTRRTPEQILYPIGMILILALGMILCIIMGNCITNPTPPQGDQSRATASEFQDQSPRQTPRRDWFNLGFLLHT